MFAKEPASIVLKRRIASASRKIPVVHVINSFESGGAEAMLCNLMLRCDRDRFEPSVVSLIDDMSVAGPILDAGFPIRTVGMKAGVPDPRGVMRLGHHLRSTRPAIVQTWMDHSNLIGSLAAMFAPHTKVVWGIHHSNHVPELTKRSTLMTVDACGLISRRLVDRIICCSEESRRMYAKRGFAAKKLMVIPNGFDTERFKPDLSARFGLRRELQVGLGATLVGLVARYDPFKDHATFLRSAAQIACQRPDVHFVLCGRGVDRANTELMSLISSLGISQRCHLLGPRSDVPRIHAAMDLVVSSSVSEAFPLVVGEAMSCGVPCVVTDVGDSALIVGDTGKVVLKGDPQALAEACMEILNLKAATRHQLGIDARARVRELFDLTAVTRRYESVYLELLAPPKPKMKPTPETLPVQVRRCAIEQRPKAAILSPAYAN